MRTICRKRFKFRSLPLSVLQIIAVLLFLHGSHSVANARMQDSKDPVVWNVSFEGNDSYSGIVLGEVIATEEPNLLRKIFRRLNDYALNETELRRDRIRIIRYYERRGYDQVQVTVDHTPAGDTWKRNVVFQIREGQPIRISSSRVRIDADSLIAEDLRKERQFQRTADSHDFQTGNRFQTIRRPDVVGNFSQIMENHGFPWASVEIEADIDSVAKQAAVEIVLKPGARSYFDEFT
ncbi:MAG TPA: POTRA domain-containing protein, partial [Balneolaceae bacterium]|nr:POTRA domain-containing protein [Balneolaceae bacterium]